MTRRGRILICNGNAMGRSSRLSKECKCHIPARGSLALNKSDLDHRLKLRYIGVSFVRVSLLYILYLALIKQDHLRRLRHMHIDRFIAHLFDASRVEIGRSATSVLNVSRTFVCVHTLVCVAERILKYTLKRELFLVVLSCVVQIFFSAIERNLFLLSRCILSVFFRNILKM